MKKLKLLLLSFLPICIFSQDFSTSFVFTDSVGNSDTIILGYSPNASDSLDVALDEVNLKESQIDTNFCVYNSDIVAFENNKFLHPSFRIKKQIVFTNGFARVDVICSKFPLTVKWDKSLFIDTSRSKSFIIISGPGGWFDAGMSPDYLVEKDSVNYSMRLINGYGNYYWDSIQGSKTNVWKIYIGFSNHDYSSEVSNIFNSKPRIYPNPCTRMLSVSTEKEIAVSYDLFNLSGQLMFSRKPEKLLENVDISMIPRGIYILKITSKTSIEFIKLIKR